MIFTERSLRFVHLFRNSYSQNRFCRFVVVETRTETRQRSFDGPQIVAYFMLRSFRSRVTRNGRARL